MNTEIEQRKGLDSTDLGVETVDVAPSTESLSRDHLAVEERTCHALPCTIDYQGMAASHIYFRPVEVDGIVSSTFRGRGLLAAMPLKEEEEKSQQNSFLSAALISVQNNQLQIKAEIDRILEWQHEHNPEALFLENGEHSRRVKIAKDWSEVATAVRFFNWTCCEKAGICWTVISWLTLFVHSLATRTDSAFIGC